MKIVVLIAGVHDPKWPIAPAGSNVPEAVADHQIMSPFDEAALEIALRIRDVNPDALIHVHVAGGIAGGKIARTVAAFNPAEISTVEINAPWDQSAVAEALTELCNSAQLVLIGREFGDFDDGLVPSMLAAKLGFGFFGRAQLVDMTGDISMVREVGSFEERCTVSKQFVISVTNDRRTRLRKPLMKNVMMARQTEIANVDISPKTSSCLKLIQAKSGSADRAATICTMFEGTYEQQAQALASLLEAVRA